MGRGVGVVRGRMERTRRGSISFKLGIGGEVGGFAERVEVVGGNGVGGGRGEIYLRCYSSKQKVAEVSHGMYSGRVFVLLDVLLHLTICSYIVVPCACAEE